MVSIDGFHKPGATRLVVSVEHCGAIRSNILQRQRILVLSGGVRSEGAEGDDSDSNQHCREHTYSSVAVDVSHKLPSISGLTLLSRTNHDCLVLGQPP